jgi:hypothetical protein
VLHRGELGRDHGAIGVAATAAGLENSDDGSGSTLVPLEDDERGSLDRRRRSILAKSALDLSSKGKKKEQIRKGLLTACL